MDKESTVDRNKVFLVFWVRSLVHVSHPFARLHGLVCKTGSAEVQKPAVLIKLVSCFEAWQSPPLSWTPTSCFPHCSPCRYHYKNFCFKNIHEKKNLSFSEKNPTRYLWKACSLLLKSLQHSDRNLHRPQRCCSWQRAVLLRLPQPCVWVGMLGGESWAVPVLMQEQPVVVWLMPSPPQQCTAPWTLPALHKCSMLFLCLWLQNQTDVSFQ